eukprot:Hpha_TRINITY_DN15909_c1_g1::TRINITY_DN15909_c1_g1_i1::g.72637::m.72637
MTVLDTNCEPPEAKRVRMAPPADSDDWRPCAPQLAPDLAAKGVKVREAAKAPPEWDQRWWFENGCWRWVCNGPHERREQKDVLTEEDCEALVGVWARNNTDLYEGDGEKRREKAHFQRPPIQGEDREIFHRLATKAVASLEKSYGEDLDLDQATLSSTNSVGHSRHADNELYIVRRCSPIAPVALHPTPPISEVRWSTPAFHADAVEMTPATTPGFVSVRINERPPLRVTSLRVDTSKHCLVMQQEDGTELSLQLPLGPPVRRLLSELRNMAQDAGLAEDANLDAVIELEGVVCAGPGDGACISRDKPAPAGTQCSRCGLRYCRDCVEEHNCQPISQLDAAMKGLATVDWRTGPTAHRNYGFSVALSHPTEYKGGGVHFVENFGDKEYCASYYAEKGCGVSFCGCRKNVHCVEPVTSGRRLVLLLWTRPRGAAPPPGAFGALPRPGTGPGVWLTMGDDGI